MITTQKIKFITFHIWWTIAWRLTVKEVSARYRGNLLGWAWLLLIPIAMIVVYTFVFYGIFSSKWSHDASTSDTGPGLFAAQLLIGLSLFSYFSDFCIRCSRLMHENHNLIKRVRFPLPTLVLSAWFCALIPLMIQLVIMVILSSWYQKLTGLWLSWPIQILLPFLLMSLGIGFFIAATSLFLKDIAHALSPAMALLMFLSPIFYSSSKTPRHFQTFLTFNPLSWPIESSRSALFQGQDPETWGLISYWLISLLLLYLGIRYFLRLSPSFVDQL
jgi:lipopolysaccharide transport system permease protein